MPFQLNELQMNNMFSETNNSDISNPIGCGSNEYAP